VHIASLYRLFSEEICTEYVAQTMFFQSPSLSNWKQARLFIPKKAKGVHKSEISKKPNRQPCVGVDQWCQIILQKQANLKNKPKIS